MRVLYHELASAEGMKPELDIESFVDSEALYFTSFFALRSRSRLAWLGVWSVARAGVWGFGVDIYHLSIYVIFCSRAKLTLEGVWSGGRERQPKRNQRQIFSQTAGLRMSTQTTNSPNGLDMGRILRNVVTSSSMLFTWCTIV